MSIASSLTSPCTAATSQPTETVMFGLRGDLLDEVVGHALVERVAAAEDRDRAGMAGEEQRCLPRRIAGADDVDLESVAVLGASLRAAP